MSVPSLDNGEELFITALSTCDKEVFSRTTRDKDELSPETNELQQKRDKLRSDIYNLQELRQLNKSLSRMIRQDIRKQNTIKL